MYPNVTVVVRWFGLSMAMLLAVVAAAPASVVGAASGDRSQVCRQTASDMLGDGSTFSVSQVADYTGCALSTRGEWFWPDTGTDPDLAVKISFTPAELERMAPLQNELVKEIAAFEEFLRSVESPFNIGPYKSILDDIEDTGALATSYGSGGFPAVWVQEYTDVVGYVVVNPDFAVFTAYAVWWANTRAAVRPMINDALPGAWGTAADAGQYWSRPPWPFEISRVYNQQRFFRWLFDTGQLVA